MTGRVLALDLGQRRIGVAISDPDRRVATPLVVLDRRRDRVGQHRDIAALAEEWEATLVLLGLPIDLKGRVGVAAEAVLAERQEMEAVMVVPVEVHDERMTTRIAERKLRERGDLDGPARRKVIDMVAASVILQDWLDARLAHDTGAGEGDGIRTTEGDR